LNEIKISTTSAESPAGARRSRRFNVRPEKCARLNSTPLRFRTVKRRERRAPHARQLHDFGEITFDSPQQLRTM
jgi:hypothetical protein